MDCFLITYRHSKGLYTATKWADKASDALEAVKKAHRRVGLQSVVGHIVYDEAEFVIPQPFSDESRARYSKQYGPPAAPSKAPSGATVEVDFSTRDEPEPTFELEAETVRSELRDDASELQETGA